MRRAADKNATGWYGKRSARGYLIDRRDREGGRVVCQRARYSSADGDGIAKDAFDTCCLRREGNVVDSNELRVFEIAVDGFLLSDGEDIRILSQ